jgi:hypothetical protein
MVRSCVSNVSSPSGVVFAAFFGDLRSSIMTHPVTLGTCRFFSFHEAFAGTIVMPYALSMLLLHSSVSPLFCPLLLPCPFPSDAPSQHRRAFITYVQVEVQVVSINAFIGCSHQDSISDFYVLPRKEMNATEAAILRTPSGPNFWHCRNA